MIEFLTLKNKAFGLDFSDCSLKIINLKPKGSFFKLASWSETELEPGIIEGGEIKNEEKLASAIKEGIAKVKGQKLKNNRVVISLPEEKAFFEIIKMPKMKKEELASAILFEAENYIPLPINEAYLDFQIIPYYASPSSNSLNVLVGAVPKKLIDSYVSSIKKAGLSPYALEIESQAISRALIKNHISPHPVAIIDFGKRRTSFIVFSGHSLQFASSIPISFDMLAQSVSKSLKIEIKKAETIIINYGLLSFSKSDKIIKKDIALQKKAFNSIVPVITDLVEQIKKYLDYYETHSENPISKKATKIILSGCGASIKGLNDFLSFETKIPVEFGNPWINILSESSKKLPDLSFKESLNYTTALGLALRGARGEK